MTSEESEKHPNPDKSNHIVAPFGFDLSEISEVAQMGNRSKALPHICVCGHSVGSHSSGVGARWFCSNGKMNCPCQNLVPVIRASDLRYFHFKTEGWGPRHALALGVHRCLEKGGTVAPLIERACFICEKPSASLLPVSMTASMVMLEKPGPFNALLCRDCWSNLPIHSG